MSSYTLTIRSGPVKWPTLTANTGSWSLVSTRSSVIQPAIFCFKDKSKATIFKLMFGG